MAGLVGLHKAEAPWHDASRSVLLFLRALWAGEIHVPILLTSVCEGALAQTDVTSGPVSAANELVALDWAMHSLENQLRKYPTTLEADEGVWRKFLH